MEWPIDGKWGEERGDSNQTIDRIPFQLRVPANRWTIAFAAHSLTMCAYSSVNEFS